MTKRTLAILIAAIACAFLISCAQAADKPVKEPRKEFTKEEIVTHMKGILDREPNVLNFVQGLERANAGGESFYTYQGVKLEELDKEKLNKLFSRIKNEAVRIRTERLSRQLESINQANIIAQQAARNAQVPVPPPQPPKIIQPPNIPKTPPALPQIPKPPPTPPTPPRR